MFCVNMSRASVGTNVILFGYPVCYLATLAGGKDGEVVGGSNKQNPGTSPVLSLPYLLV